MSKDYSLQIAKELNLPTDKIIATIKLLDDGSSVPFISRYRKEVTGSLDEVAIMNIRDRVTQLRELDKRRDTIIASIKDQKKLTDVLEKKILAALTMAELEDIYLPYKPKRRTKGMMGKEKGLEPLAKVIYEQKGIDVQEEAKKYVNEKLKVLTVDDALAGARDIMAEWINEIAELRAELRVVYQSEGTMTSKIITGKQEEGQKFKDYFDWKETVTNVPSHRILAVRRGEKEKILMSRILAPKEKCLNIIRSFVIKGKGQEVEQVELALEDSFKRLLSMSLESETRLVLKKRADDEAINVFTSNLRELLMAAPLGQKNIMAIDPGLRTGCKVVCLNQQGMLLHNDTVYLVGSVNQKEEAKAIIKKLCDEYKVEVIAIGNGTASRETESFVKQLGLKKDIQVVLVSESGASIYSASEVARDEFPDYDVTVRGSISIGRRLMDPLAELVKIDAKNIGVGQYQHDVDQRLLKTSLDDVVVSCVNQVGVEINTASKQLLTYVSGLGPTRAQSLIDHRNKYGAFKSLASLAEVEGLGKKAMEQAVGFLRIHDAENPLDASAVHLESYVLVDQMAKDVGCSLVDLINNAQLRDQIQLNKYVTEDVGMPTLEDIKNELAKPGRDPRASFEGFSYKEGVDSIEDLEAGMELPGIITNVTAFGAFVDIGVHHDGLIHISQLSDRFVKDPHNIVKVHQHVSVTVLEVDMQRKRIALTCRTQS